jgi:hypothetical protein
MIAWELDRSVREIEWKISISFDVIDVLLNIMLTSPLAYTDGSA